MRFRTGKSNVEAVQVIMDGMSIDMEKCSSDELFDYYEAVIPCGNGGQEYYSR